MNEEFQRADVLEEAAKLLESQGAVIYAGLVRTMKCHTLEAMLESLAPNVSDLTPGFVAGLDRPPAAIQPSV